MASKKVKGSSRKGSVNTGSTAGVDSGGCTGEYGVVEVMDAERNGRGMKKVDDCVEIPIGMLDEGEVPESSDEQDVVVLSRPEGGRGVPEVFRRSVPEREVVRRQRLPRVAAFGDFLRMLGMFAGKGGFSGCRKGGRSDGLKAFRELERLASLYGREIADGEGVFPSATVCIRRKGDMPGAEGVKVCEGLVIDLSDLFQ